jgi:hypothetical protein
MDQAPQTAQIARVVDHGLDPQGAPVLQVLLDPGVPVEGVDVHRGAVADDLGLERTGGRSTPALPAFEDQLRAADIEVVGHQGFEETPSVPGDWTVHQGNGYTVHMEVLDEVSDGSFSGRTTVDGQAGTRDLLDAQVTDDEISFKVAAGPVTGVYTGHFDFQGRLSGNAFQIENPTIQTTWFADRLFAPR